MLSTEYCPHPMSDLAEIITKPYVFKSLDYCDAIEFHQILSGFLWPYCDYSEVCEDVELIGGKPRTSWIVYFNMRPQDEKRLEFVTYHMKGYRQGNFYIEDVLPW